MDAIASNRRANPPGKLADKSCPTEPRMVGGVYWNHYWDQTYTITAAYGAWIEGVWEDGIKFQHCTAWDWAKDRIISEP